MVIKLNNTKQHKHILRNLWYIGRKKEENERFTIYDRTGDVIHKDGFPQLKQDLSQYDFFYRVVVSPDPKSKITHEQMSLLTQNAIDQIEKHSKVELIACYSIHDDTDVLHSHIVIWGFWEQLKMSKREFLRMKENVQKQENKMQKENIVELEQKR